MTTTPRAKRKTRPAGDFLYREIAGHIRGDIRGGRYRPGTRLPSLDQLALEHKANRLTVLRALNSLKLSGFVYSVPAQGIYVSDAIPDTDEPVRPKSGFKIGLVSQVMMHGRIGAYHADIISGIQEALVPVRGNLSLVPLLNVERERDMMRLAFQERTDAMIYLGPFQESTLIHMLENGPPSVLADNRLTRFPADSIVVDNRGGGFQVMEYLIGLGHRQFAVITGPDDQPAGPERLAGMREAAQAHKLPASGMILVPGDFSRESGMEAMRRILKTHRSVTAVVCMNDDMAAGALQVIHAESSLRVPGDLSVTGFDNLNIAHATHPPLTTLHIDRHNVGRMAVQRLLERMERPDAPPVSISIQTQLMVRASTGKPPKR